MFRNLTDIDLLAGEAIRVKHVATMDLVSAAPGECVAEALAWMVVNDFDVAPARAADRIMGFVRRADLEMLEAEDRVSGALRPLSDARTIASSASLLALLELLRETPWALVSEDDEPCGIVTWADLARPAVSLFVFAGILAVEAGLRRLAGSYSNRPIADVSVGAGADEADYLPQVLSLARESPELRRDLGYPSKTKFKNATDFLIGLRNDLAHGRSILAGAEPAKRLDHLARLDALLHQISHLAGDRQQVWDAFERTEILGADNRLWTGPDAVDPGLGWPVHVITAENPFEEVLQDVVNQERTAALRSVLELRGLQFQPVVGQSPDGAWREQSFAVAGLTRDEACALGKLFCQRAIFELDAQSLAVVAVDGGIRGRRARGRAGSMRLARDTPCPPSASGSTS